MRGMEEEREQDEAQWLAEVGRAEAPQHPCMRHPERERHPHGYSKESLCLECLNRALAAGARQADDAPYRDTGSDYYAIGDNTYYRDARTGSTLVGPWNGRPTGRKDR